MARVALDGRRITDWPSFHRESQAAFGFPAYYGANLDAWVDCLSGVRDGDGMSGFALGPGEMLEIELQHADVLRSKTPRILETLEALIDAANERITDAGQKPGLRLIET
ncbi:barstar family protein [Noviherbaspirillum pedocola]|uniref:Barstar family protein n=1 Tax=Noviherbaspirillum pedocola TaxID=2801341 RepID=A0A934SQQ7_9BURK|nr:barstar family protein [Noviherbaspirillum pedocola]MBK4734850.1 barstar family protein [Noviherbaspirillum pedocola]